MVSFHAWQDKAYNTLKFTAKALESSLNWLRPWGIKKQFLDINIRYTSHKIIRRTPTYTAIDGLEKKIQHLESNREAHATNYGLIRTLLAFPIAPFVAHVYHLAAPTFDNSAAKDHPLCYLGAIMLAYVTGTILGKTAKTKFENKVQDELHIYIDPYKESPKEEKDECEYSEQQYKPPEFDFVPEQTPPSIKPRANMKKTFDEPKPQTNFPLPKEIKWEELERDINNYEL